VRVAGVIMQVFRSYARVYTAELDTLVSVLASLVGEPVEARFSMPNGLELAMIGRVLVVAGDEQTLAPVRATQATLVVDDLDECQAMLSAADAQLVRGPHDVPTGRNLTARLADGVQVEYVEWNRAQWERVNTPDS